MRKRKKRERRRKIVRIVAMSGNVTALKRKNKSI